MLQAVNFFVLAPRSSQVRRGSEVVRSARIELAPAPWQGALLPLNYDREKIFMPGARIELATPSSSGLRSTTELPRHRFDKP